MPSRKVTRMPKPPTTQTQPAPSLINDWDDPEDPDQDEAQFDQDRALAKALPPQSLGEPTNPMFDSAEQEAEILAAVRERHKGKTE